MTKNSDTLAILIAKKNSTRLPGKNNKMFKGVPMFLWNLQKLIDLFETVVFDSDCEEMLRLARSIGAISHNRINNLLGDEVPSVPIFKSIIDEYPAFSSILNLQANSPNVSNFVIQTCGKVIALDGIREVLTSYSNGKINGSVWGITRERLLDYGDFYTHSPDVLVLDNSIDIHTQDEFNKALNNA